MPNTTQTKAQVFTPPLYGQRLQMAMDHLGDTRGWPVTRKDVAQAAGTTVQNVGMVINNALGRDQRFHTRSHAAVAAYLRVRSEWLLDGMGPMEPEVEGELPSKLTPAAVDLAVLYDMIPSGDTIRRAQAFNAASMAIMQLLQPGDATLALSPRPQTPSI